MPRREQSELVYRYDITSSALHRDAIERADFNYLHYSPDDEE
jgi:hypothetical protein